MKKKIILLCLTTITIVSVFYGCGKKEQTSSVKKKSAPKETTIVVENKKGSELDITTLSKKEYAALTWDQIRDFVEEKLPTFREVYGIPEDKKLEQADWEEIKKIIFWQLHNETLEKYLTSVGSGETETPAPTVDANEIYTNPKAEVIEKLSIGEFRTYMKNFLTYAGAASDAITAIDNLTSDQMKDLRVQFIEDQCTGN
jgi:uncharacterized lipoprotein YehR (DUF1307 family)